MCLLRAHAGGGHVAPFTPLSKEDFHYLITAVLTRKHGKVGAAGSLAGMALQSVNFTTPLCCPPLPQEIVQALGLEDSVEHLFTIFDSDGNGEPRALPRPCARRRSHVGLLHSQVWCRWAS